MENATKAILIAGGLLLAMITISIFYFAFGKAGELAGEASTDTQKQELLDFNKSFEAYNKKLMYGTDIITVLNKAIDNNIRYGVEFGTDSSNLNYMDYYVDVEFTVFERDENGRKIGKSNTKTYSLSSNYKSKNDTIFKDYIEKAAKGDNSDVFRTFKFSGFKCKDVFYQDRASVASSNLGAVR